MWCALVGDALRRRAPARSGVASPESFLLLIGLILLNATFSTSPGCLNLNCRSLFLCLVLWTRNAGSRRSASLPVRKSASCLTNLSGFVRHAGYRTSRIKLLDRDAAVLRATRLGMGSRAAYGVVRHLQSRTHVRARLDRDDSAMTRKTVVLPVSSHPSSRLELESTL